MRIYLDTCSLQRPLDAKTEPRIIVESEAVLAIVSLCDAGELELVASEVLFFETERNPHATRKDYALRLLAKATAQVATTDEVKKRAEVLHQAGIAPLDALHLASATEAKATYFCSCDDKLLKRAKAVDTAETKVVSPTELVREIDDDDRDETPE